MLVVTTGTLLLPFLARSGGTTSLAVGTRVEVLLPAGPTPLGDQPEDAWREARLEGSASLRGGKLFAQNFLTRVTHLPTDSTAPRKR